MKTCHHRLESALTVSGKRSKCAQANVPFLGSDSQGRFRGEFLSDAFPLILPCRPPNEIRVAWRDIVGFDAETGVGHLVD